MNEAVISGFLEINSLDLCFGHGLLTLEEFQFILMLHFCVLFLYNILI